MKTDVSMIDRWPHPVMLDIDIYYRRSELERRSYLLSPAHCAPEVCVLMPQLVGRPLELQRVRWSQLPARTLYLRCLNVLALHWFGEVTMPPRVCGAPLWNCISVDVSTDDHHLQGLSFQLDVVDDRRAALCYRGRDGQPLVRRSLVLDPLDADPLRALLRIGATHVRPVSVRSAAPERVALTSKQRHAAPAHALPA